MKPQGRKIWNATEELASFAAPTIRDHHPHLEQASIEYLFREKAGNKAGRRVLGSAGVATDKDAALAGKELHFVITLAHDWWTEEATERAQAAVIDHELSHCYFDEDGEPKIAGHDTEEFVAVLARHGVYKTELEAFVGVASQLAFEFGEEPMPEVA